MKKLVIIAMLFITSIAAFAQKASEVIYLKNGSVIKGNVIEQNMSNQTIKLQTADGSIFVYALSDVEKIEKNIIEKNIVANNDDDEDDDSPSIKYPTKGYRGFGGLSSCIGVGDYPFNKIGIHTTHGIQLNSLFYLGAGLQVQDYYDDDLVVLTPYIDLNFNILKKKCSPTIDLKAGYSFNDIEGFYWSSSVGLRVNRCHFMLGYEWQKETIGFTEYRSYYPYDNEYSYNRRYDYTFEEWTSAFFLSFSIDFGHRR